LLSAHDGERANVVNSDLALERDTVASFCLRTTVHRMIGNWLQVVLPTCHPASNAAFTRCNRRRDRSSRATERATQSRDSRMNIYYARLIRYGTKQCSDPFVCLSVQFR